MVVEHVAKRLAEAHHPAQRLVLVGDGVTRHVTHDRRTAAEAEKLPLAEVRTLNELLPICTFCHKVREDEGYWSDLNAYLREHAGSQLSHALCPDCLASRFGDLITPESEA